LGISQSFPLWGTTLKWSLHDHCLRTVVLASRNYCTEVKNNIKKLQ
jgi:hypothetical protein